MKVGEQAQHFQYLIKQIDLTRDAFVMALTQHINEIWKDEKC